MKVLFFSAWFPNKYNLLAGNFAYHHAKALQNKVNIGVFSVIADKQLNKVLQFEKTNDGNVQIYKIYYKQFSSKFLFPFTLLCFVFATIYGYIKVQKAFGLADINHVHVLTRTAIIPYFLKRIYKIPFVISEHWSRYLSERDEYKGFFRKKTTSFIVKKSAGICAVSNDLRQAMQNHNINHKNFRIISNTIDTQKFTLDYELKKDKNRFRFIHVSSSENRIKNVWGILNAVLKLSEIRNNFEIYIIGDSIDHQEFKTFVINNKLENIVKFFNEIFGNELLKQFQQADAFVLFSNFENQPCVLLESFCCGLPVIATRVGGVPEIVNEHNGVLVNTKDEKALAQAMLDFMDGKIIFNKEKIRQDAVNNYSYEVVAQSLLNFYNDALSVKA